MAGSPPPFNPPQAGGKSSKLWLWLILAAVALCFGMLGLIFFGWKGMMGKANKVGGCLVGGELAMISVMAYAEENDGAFPNAATWQENTEVYYGRLKNKLDSSLDEIPDWVGLDFNIPQTGEPITCNWSEDWITGFVYNSDLEGKNVDDFDDLSEVAVVFESRQYGYNASASAESIDNNDEMLTEMKRKGWTVYYADTETMTMDSQNAEMDFDLTIKDALSDDAEEEAATDEAEAVDSGDTSVPGGENAELSGEE